MGPLEGAGGGGLAFLITRSFLGLGFGNLSNDTQWSIDLLSLTFVKFGLDGTSNH